MALGLWNILEKVGMAEVVTDNHPSPVTPAPAAPAAPVAIQPPSNIAIGAPASGVDPNLVANLDKSSKLALAKALEVAPTHIVDAWGNTLEPLEAAIPDEAARYKAALSILTRTHTLDALVADLDNCIGVTEETHRNFVATLERQLDQQVGSKIRAVEDYNSQIASIQTKLQELGAQLVDLEAKRGSEQSGISQEQSKLDLTKSRFELAYQEVKQGLEDQKQKVLRYGAPK